MNLDASKPSNCCLLDVEAIIFTSKGKKKKKRKKANVCSKMNFLKKYQP
jgi:hypothetical protein